MEVKERAAAKINLGLDVLNKREDGYHDVETIMVSVDLADYLIFKDRHDGKIEIKTENSFLPLDERNHIYQAVCLMKEAFHQSQGVTIELIKKIPVSAGMGGGSSDAAATLRGLNRLWNLEAPLAKLAEIGAEIGADVPYCLYEHVAYAKGIGNELCLLPDIPSCWILLVKPAVSISTPKIFDQLCLEQICHPDIDRLRQAIEEGDFTLLCQHAENVLETVTTLECEELCKIRKTLEKTKAQAVVMSGTGPTMVGLFKTHRQAIQAQNAIRGFCKESYLVRPLKNQRKDD